MSVAEARRHVESAIDWLEQAVLEDGETYLVTEAIGDLHHALKDLRTDDHAEPAKAN